MIKQISILVVISILSSLLVFSLLKEDVSFAGFSRMSSVNVIPTESTDGFSVGTTTNASLVTYVGGGTCTLVSDSSIAATSTGTGTCATTGSQAGDIVFLGVATTTTKQTANIIPIGIIAGSNSTTVRLFNLTGAAIVPAAVNGFGSSTPYSVFRMTTTSSSLFNQ